jgi:hypothetical protein
VDVHLPAGVLDVNEDFVARHHRSAKALRHPKSSGDDHARCRDDARR